MVLLLLWYFFSFILLWVLFIFITNTKEYICLLRFPRSQESQSWSHGHRLGKLLLCSWSPWFSLATVFLGPDRALSCHISLVCHGSVISGFLTSRFLFFLRFQETEQPVAAAAHDAGSTACKALSVTTESCPAITLIIIALKTYMDLESVNEF